MKILIDTDSKTVQVIKAKEGEVLINSFKKSVKTGTSTVIGETIYDLRYIDVEGYSLMINGHIGLRCKAAFTTYSRIKHNIKRIISILKLI